jgi:hypothetical protein
MVRVGEIGSDGKYLTEEEIFGKDKIDKKRD